LIYCKNITTFYRCNTAQTNSVL